MNVPPLMVAIATMGLVGGALAAFGAGLSGRTRPVRRGTRRVGPGAITGQSSRSFIVASVVALLVLLVSRWPVLAIVSGVGVVMWGPLMSDREAEEERARVEGISKWLDDLRDTLRGSSMGLEEALEHSASRPPAAIEPALTTFLVHRRQGFRTEDALQWLAHDLAHPLGDSAVAAMRLVVSGVAGAGRLHGTVEALAASARDELAARERIDRARAVYRHSMRRLVVIAILLIGYLRITAADLVRPYGTPSGQVMLLVPLGLWAACILWLRSLCRDDSRSSRRPSTDSSMVVAL
jgi:hypothetical protein